MFSDKSYPQISQRGRAATKEEKTLTADGRGSTRMKKMNQVQGGRNQWLRILRSSALIRDTAGKPGRAQITANERGGEEGARYF